jgi:hypothetical protein
MSRRVSFIGWACAVGLVLVASGCVVRSEPAGPPPDTEIGFQPWRNFHSPAGDGCGSGLTTWSITNRQTSENQTGDCSTEAVFTGLDAGTSYDFDIVGYASGNTICWQGACNVSTVGGYGLLNEADCTTTLPYTCH